MAKIRIRLDKRNVKIQSLIRDLGPKKTAQVLYTSSEHVLIPAMRKKLIENRSIDTGKLFRSLNTKAIVLRGQGAVEVGTIGVEYGLNIETGSKPHTPDFRRLLDWVRRKLKPKGNPVFTTSNISRTIQKRGTKAKPFIVPTFIANQERLANDFVTRMRVHLRTK